MGFTNPWVVPLAVVSITAARAASRQVRTVGLLAASGAFYWLIGAGASAVILMVVLSSWLGGTSIAQTRTSARTTGWVLLTLCPLLFSKYLPWLDGALHSGQWWQSESVGGRGVPPGLSFVTLQAIGYLLDVKRGRIAPTERLAAHSLFLAFFPQLVAGPIERAASLRPQLENPARPTPMEYYAAAKLVLWGYTLKLLLADQLSAPIDTLLAEPGDNAPAALLLALFLFSFRLFFDFYGYSCIAVGLGKAHGVSLVMNFEHPYGAASLSVFWRRWHVSLSSWWRDYLYIPIGGNRRGWLRRLTAIFAVFVLSGIWHGAGLGFVLWGAAYAVLVLIEQVLKRAGIMPADPHGQQLRAALAAAGTFVIVTVLWLPFLASTEQNLPQLVLRLWHCVAQWQLSLAALGKLLPHYTLPLLLGATGVALERPLRRWYWDSNPRDRTLVISDIALTNVMLLSLLLFGDFGGQSFIYFAF